MEEKVQVIVANTINKMDKLGIEHPSSKELENVILGILRIKK